MPVKKNILYFLPSIIIIYMNINEYEVNSTYIFVKIKQKTYFY